MKNKRINQILMREIMKEYFGVVLTIIICLVLLYISIFIAKFATFVLIFYFVISLKYIIKLFKNESLFLHIYRTNKSSKVEAKALVEHFLSLYDTNYENKNKNPRDDLNHILDQFMHVNQTN
jgi:cobalamin biosynthesis protein CobD/CbiB